MTHNHSSHEKPPCVSAPTIRLAWRIFAVVLVLVVALQWVITPHPYFGIDGNFWFFPVYGLLSSMAMVLVSNLFGRVLKRPEHYWKDKP